MSWSGPATPEHARVALLQATRLLEASETPPAFAALARLAATQTASPQAAIHLIDAHCVRLLAGVGALPKRQSREHALSTQALQQDGPWQAHDTRDLPHPPHLPADAWPVAYAGHPLVVEGQTLGALCVMDTEARQWTDAQIAGLADVACATSALLAAELNQQTKEIQSQSSNSMIDVDKLQTAFDQIFETIDIVNDFKVKSLPNLQKSMDHLEAQLQRAQYYTDQVRSQEVEKQLQLNEKGMPNNGAVELERN